jgi:hypothetical protein
MKNRNVIFTTILFVLGCLALPYGGQAADTDDVLPAVNKAAGAGVLTKRTSVQLLYDYGIQQSILPDGAAHFYFAPLVVGTAITKTDDTTFTLNEDGVYRVSYMLQNVAGYGTVQVQVNGTAVGPGIFLNTGGGDPTTVTDLVTFTATAGNTVQIVNVGNLTANLNTASINIDKVQ